MSISIDLLNVRKNLPLEAKITLSQQRVRSWYDHYHGGIYIAFSGGKDSTVLLDLVREYYPDVPAVFVDTGLEYPEVREFVKTVKNVVWLKPKMNFKKVIETYGYPVISKMQAQYIDFVRNCKTDCKTKQLRLNGTDKYSGSKQYKISEKWKYLLKAPFKISDKCCKIMKKDPFHLYEKETGRKPIIGTMACESIQRKKQYLQNGCNAFDMKKPQSRPIMFWKEEDIWEYIKHKKLDYAKIYDQQGIFRTGCIFCAFGSHLEERPNRYDVLKKTHPKLWDYCMKKLGFSEVLDFLNIGH